MITRPVCTLVFLWAALSRAIEPWEEALAIMPLGAPITRLDRTNCVPLLLNAFRSNQLVKALVFMPGATDEFYMFRRAQAVLTNQSPTLLDAINALRSQTRIRASFYPPLLLLRTDEDPVEPDVQIEDQAVAQKLKQLPFVDHALFNDRDWDFLEPLLKKKLKADIRPWRFTYDSWHFYRHSFAGWNLTGWEAIQAIALAGKTRVALRRKPGFSFHHNQVVFRCDLRAPTQPAAPP